METEAKVLRGQLFQQISMRASLLDYYITIKKEVECTQDDIKAAQELLKIVKAQVVSYYRSWLGLLVSCAYADNIP